VHSNPLLRRGTGKILYGQHNIRRAQAAVKEICSIINGTQQKRGAGNQTPFLNYKRGFRPSFCFCQLAFSFHSLQMLQHSLFQFAISIALAIAFQI
jgi:hypothetical protein